MYSVYQHWDPLKTCIVGKSYPPEFYSWIKNPKTRSIFERIAQETEEDYQSLIKLLESFQVEVLRPNIPADHELLINHRTKKFITPPMAPRDEHGMYGANLFSATFRTIEEFYNEVKDISWPDNIKTVKDIKNLPPKIFNEIIEIIDPDFAKDINYMSNDETHMGFNFYNNIYKDIKEKCNITYSMHEMSTATTTRIGKDLYFSSGCDDSQSNYVNERSDVFENYRKHFLNLGTTHTDGVFSAVVPGLIISLHDIPNYKDTFPDWEVVYLPDQSWNKVRPFLDLKEKNHGKWWIPGEEYNDDVFEVVDTWLSKWVGYVEETVFDVNMIVINEKNVVVNNYNKQVFDALERYGVTPHICNFRHRYFWDGGLHCITTDLDREGEMKDYFPERG